MNVDYAILNEELESGAFRERLQEELTLGFRQILESGERLPTASHFATQIAEIVNRGAETALDSGIAFYLYQEILLACENARIAVLATVN
jgi:hypothetical protein